MIVPSRRSAYLLLFLLISTMFPTAAGAQMPAGCTATVPAGGDISRAVAGAAPGSTVCLEPGEYAPFVVERAASERITLRGAGTETTRIVAAGSTAVHVSSGGLTLSGLTVQGGAPAGVYAGIAEVTLRDVLIRDALVGIDAGSGSRVQIEGATVARPHDVGLLAREAADVRGSGLLVEESSGYGIALAAKQGRLELANSEVRGGVGPGVFAGVPGCAAVAAETPQPPACFLNGPEAYESEVLVSLTRVRVERMSTEGMLFHPGVRATVRDSDLHENQGGGLFSWGADVELSNARVSDNLGHGLLFRAFPDPRQQPVVMGAARVRDTTVSNTRALGGPFLGHGIVAEGGVLRIEATYVRDSAGMGLAYLHGASGGAFKSVLHVNAGAAFCVTPGSVVEAAENLIGGNGNDQAGPCEAAPPAPPPPPAPVVSEPLPSPAPAPSEPPPGPVAQGEVEETAEG